MVTAPDRRLETLFTINTKRESRLLKVSVSGELDMATGQYLRSAVTCLLFAAPPEGMSVTLDLSEVTFIDAGGYRAIDSISRSVGEIDLGFRITKASPAVRRFLALIGRENLVQLRRVESFVDAV